MTSEGKASAKSKLHKPPTCTVRGGGAGAVLRQHRVGELVTVYLLQYVVNVCGVPKLRQAKDFSSCSFNWRVERISRRWSVGQHAIEGTCISMKDG